MKYQDIVPTIEALVELNKDVRTAFMWGLITTDEARDINRYLARNARPLSSDTAREVIDEADEALADEDYEQVAFLSSVLWALCSASTIGSLQVIKAIFNATLLQIEESNEELAINMYAAKGG